MSRRRLEAWGDRLRVLVGALRIFSDRRSARRFYELQRLWRHEHGERGAGRPVPLRLRAMEPAPLMVRPGTSDADVIADNFVLGFHLPPPEMRDRDLRTICELGTNVGIGLADLARRHPGARLLGVEPDPENAALARRNLAAFAERCELVEAAVWDSDAELVLEGDLAHGLTVRERREGDDRPTLHGLGLDGVLARLGDGSIDYLLMDVEGTERRLLHGPAPWAERVQSIKVELHPETGYSGEDCARDLERLGFRAQVDALWWGGFALGVR